MINQKAISVKMNYDVLEALNEECYISGVPRNRLINKAVRNYIDMIDENRRSKAHGGGGSSSTNIDTSSMGKYILSQFGHNDSEKIRHIAKSCDVSVLEVVLYAVDALLKNWDKRPFAYL